MKSESEVLCLECNSSNNVQEVSIGDSFILLCESCTNDLRDILLLVEDLETAHGKLV